MIQLDDTLFFHCFSPIVIVSYDGEIMKKPFFDSQSKSQCDAIRGSLLSVQKIVNFTWPSITVSSTVKI